MNDGKVLIVGVDVDSIHRPAGFSWSTADEGLQGQDDPHELACTVANEINRGLRVILAFECPLSVPVPELDGGSWKLLGRARTNEGNRPWSAGAGATTLATGLAQVTWIMSAIRAESNEPPCVTTKFDRLSDGPASLLIVEAMVTGVGKRTESQADQDHDDAVAAAQRFEQILDELPRSASDVTCAPQGALNLAVAAALHAGLPIDGDELREDVFVGRVRGNASTNI